MTCFQGLLSYRAGHCLNKHLKERAKRSFGTDVSSYVSSCYVRGPGLAGPCVPAYWPGDIWPSWCQRQVTGRRSNDERRFKGEEKETEQHKKKGSIVKEENIILMVCVCAC